jgi:hypothetical protein
MVELAAGQANILQLIVIEHMQFAELPFAEPISNELAQG